MQAPQHGGLLSDLTAQNSVAINNIQMNPQLFPGQILQTLQAYQNPTGQLQLQQQHDVISKLIISKDEVSLPAGMNINLPLANGTGVGQHSMTHHSEQQAQLIQQLKASLSEDIAKKEQQQNWYQ